MGGISAARRFVRADECGELPAIKKKVLLWCQRERERNRQRAGRAQDFPAANPCLCLFTDGGSDEHLLGLVIFFVCLLFVF